MINELRTVEPPPSPLEVVPEMNPDPVKVCLSGDWHGQQNWAVHCLHHAARNGCDAMVQLGDFGFWTAGHKTDKYLRTVGETAQELGIRFYWLDGNHEDHTRREEFFANPFPGVTYLPRGWRWDWWGYTWMAVGGAVSVDKEYREEGKSWWPEEELTDAEVKWASRPGRVDILLAHDCPRGVDIPGVGPDTKGGVRGDWPLHILKEAEAHRDKLKTIRDAVKAKIVVHGHYHIPYEWHDHGLFVRGLGCDGDSTMLSNVIVGPDDLDPEGTTT